MGIARSSMLFDFGIAISHTSVRNYLLIIDKRGICMIFYTNCTI